MSNALSDAKNEYPLCHHCIGHFKEVPLASSVKPLLFIKTAIQTIIFGRATGVNIADDRHAG
jgi:hypothetical protein